MAFLDTKHKKRSIVITIIFHVTLIILLLLFGFKYLDPPPENGIAINFGTTNTGQGDNQPTEPVRSAPQQTNSEPTPVTPAEVKEEVVTQDTEEAPVIKKDELKESPKKPKEEPKEKPKEEIKEPDPKPDKSTSDALSSLINAPKNSGTANAGEGNDAVAGDKGNPDGNPNSSSYYGSGKGLDGDGNYLLSGRKALNKVRESQTCNEAGKVVVSIEVDKTGRVLNAVPGVRGTTNNTKCLLDKAKENALATKFNPDSKAPVKQIGKIVYNFKLSE